MRTLTLSALLSLALLGAAAPALAEDEPEVTREEVERKKGEVREMERKLREQESKEEAERIQDELRRRREAREDRYYEERARRERAPEMRAWIGLGTGLSYAWIDTDCGASGVGAECSEQGLLSTYIGNVTFAAANGMALRLRGMRATESGNDSRTPYETAALVGARFGRSSWYGLFGAGVLHSVDDDFVKGNDAVTGLAWEIIFAPSADGPMGMELGFQGNSGEHADFIAFNVGVRFGALR